MDDFLVKCLFLNSLFYLFSLMVHKISSENWRVEPQPTMKYLKIDNSTIQLLIILTSGVIVFALDIILKNKIKK
jgi:hypothetical protein